MVSNRHSHDAVNDVLRLTARCKGSNSEWVKFRKLVEDKDTDPDYGRMLAIILSKADEHRNRESDNSHGGVGIHIKREAGASGSKPKPKRLRVEKSESRLENKRRGSDVRGLRISEPDRKITNRSSRKQSSRGTEDTKASVVRINNSPAKGGRHYMRGVRVGPSNKDKVRGKVGRVGSGENSALFRKCAANRHLDDRNAEVGRGEKSSIFRKRAANDHLDRNVKAKSIRKQLKHCEIRKTKTESTDETDDDLEILEDNEFLEDIRSFVPSKRFHNSMEEDADFGHRGRRSSSKSAPDGFRKEVLDVIGQPFDKHELEGLRESARNGSYYHYYPDLESKLKRCRYQRGKCLTILRGFFFWLQNVSKEGAFKPWKDGQCLAVEPAYPESSPPPPPPSSARLDRGKAKLSKDSKPKIFK